MSMTEKEVAAADDALAGARDIIAEWVNEDSEARAAMRTLFLNEGVIHSRLATDKEAEGAKYRDYFDWEEPASVAPSHRILAMRRGEREDFLNLSMAPDEEPAVAILESLFVKGEAEDCNQVTLAVRDCYKRLLSRSMETEMRLDTKETADKEAIRVFTDNLRQLLLAPPLGAKHVLAIDPGFRTGCKVVCLDRQGKLLHNDTVYPHTSEKQRAGRPAKDRRPVRAISHRGHCHRQRHRRPGNRGVRPKSLACPTASRWSWSTRAAPPSIRPPKSAREEFPDQDVTVRGAVSIGRRLMDPLAELVKIDPKSIGVGQYQHDVDQSALEAALDDVVVSCVNSVGVDVNTRQRSSCSPTSPAWGRNWPGTSSPTATTTARFRSRGSTEEGAAPGPQGL